MARLPNDGEYITAGVPREMLSGEVEGDGLPQGVSVDSQPGLTQIRIPSPPDLGMVSPQPMIRRPVLPDPIGIVAAEPIRPLTFDFALLPDVQCHLELRGPATADHLEQLVSYLTVAVEKIRQQEARGERAVKSEKRRGVEEASRQPIKRGGKREPADHNQSSA